MSDLYIKKSKYKDLVSKNLAIVYTDKVETFLSVIISLLAAIGIFRTIIQSLS